MIDLDSDIIKLIIAVFLGSVIGAEREYKSKAVGFRTVILITLGSCLFTIISGIMGGDKDPARIAANIVTGIGFLGAGAIFRDDSGVKGITTAATIWVASAMGMSIGIGQYMFACITCGMALLVLLGFAWFQNMIDRTNTNKVYKITLAGHDIRNKGELEKIISECKMQGKCVSHSKVGGEMIVHYKIQGSLAEHDELVKQFYENGLINGFES